MLKGVDLEAVGVTKSGVGNLHTLRSAVVGLDEVEVGETS